MTASLTINRKYWQAMQAHVAAEAPLEACGLLAGTGSTILKVYCLENELRSPTRFRIAPRAQLEAFEGIEAQGMQLLAIYHSHPEGPSQPSPTDIAEAFYSEALHVIWSRAEGQWDCRAFRIGADGASEVELHLIEEQATPS